MPIFMTADTVIEEIKALPPGERERVVKFVVEQDDSWIPNSFKRGMADVAAGRLVEMETLEGDQVITVDIGTHDIYKR